MTRFLLMLALPLAALADDPPPPLPESSLPGVAVRGLAAHAPAAAKDFETRAGAEIPPTNAPEQKTALTFHMPRTAVQALKSSRNPSPESVQAKPSHAPVIAASRNDVAPFEFLSVAALLSLAGLSLAWWACLSVLKVSACFVSRKAGLFHPAHYRVFTWFWYPWRWPFLHLWLRFAWWKEEIFDHGHRATARPASLLETAVWLYKPRDIYLGRIRAFGMTGFQPVGLPDSDDRHLMMIAGSGSGKTVQEIALISLHDGPLLCIDPKRQSAKVLSKRMGSGGNGVIGKGMKVCILDPQDPESAHWNCFDEFPHARRRALAAGRDPDDATVKTGQRILDGLIVRYADSNPFWPGASKNFVLGVVLWMDKNLPRGECNLGKLYDLVTIGLPLEAEGDETGMEALYRRMWEDPSYGGVIGQSAAGMIDASRETSGSILITIQEQLQFLKRPALRRISERSDFHLEELTSNLALFVCANLTDIRKEFPGWFRLLVVMALGTFEDINRRLERPCLFCLDEMANLGKVEAIDTASSYMRSFGIRLLCIIQNIGQLKEAGYSNWETFTGNAAACWIMATKHSDNLAYVTGRLGKCTVKEKLDGPPWWWRPFTRRQTRHGLTERDVMTPDQAERFLAQGNMIVFRDQRALILKRDPYFKALPVCLYEADPDFRETFLRRQSRRFFVWWLGRSEEKQAFRAWQKERAQAEAAPAPEAPPRASGVFYMPQAAEPEQAPGDDPPARPAPKKRTPRKPKAAKPAAAQTPGARVQ